MGRIRRGWELTKKSWGLLRENPSLIRFPVYGAIATTLLAVAVLGPGLFFLDDDKSGIGIPLIVIGVYVLTVAGLYFSVGLAAAADMIFREWVYGDSPATELGEQEWEYFEGRGVSRTFGLANNS